MERNTVLAIVLSTIVLIVSFALQGLFSPPAPVINEQTPPGIIAVDPGVTSYTQPDSSQTITTPSTSIDTSPTQAQIISQDDIPLQPPIIIENEFFSAAFSNSGGNLVSLRWRDQRKDIDTHDAYVDLILSGSDEAKAFAIAFGGVDARPVTANFNVRPRASDYVVEFYRDFIFPSSVYGSTGRFTLTKRYTFKPNDYMFELKIIMSGDLTGLNFDGTMYTLSFGPQIGPAFQRLDGYYDYRHFNVYTNGRRRDAKVNEIISNSTWTAISGKYFAFIAYPRLNLNDYVIRFSDNAEPGLTAASRFNLTRSPSSISSVVSSSNIEDTFLFYLGPKTQEILGNYNNGRNEFNVQDVNFNEIANTRGFWGIFSPLERALKWLLMGIHRAIPNYGISIILLTLLIKLLFFPLTKKGSEATLKMQALGPKIKEMQDKYKNDPQKLRLEMGKFYQQEGYNPISGCLPMLLQLPIFISMFSLFNNHFDLRGAMFIPGWIPDLSLPEYIIQFPEGFRIPLLGWTALRLLPFIYVGSQLVYGKVTQMPGQQSNTQMKIMLFVMPIVFFFVLYDVPSGLLVYWIFSNLLTLVQQVIINKFVMQKRAAMALAEAEKPPAAAPPPSQNRGGGKKKKKKS